MKHNVKAICYEEISNHLYYKDGVLLWKKSSKPAGTKTKEGYIKIQINKVPYFAHRLIWVLFNKNIPLDKQIDHIDRNKSNNKIENLRLVDSIGNALNRPFKISNTGIKGVSLDRKYYKVSFTINNKSVHFGNFDNLELAELVSIEIQNKYHSSYLVNNK